MDCRPAHLGKKEYSYERLLHDNRKGFKRPPKKGGIDLQPPYTTRRRKGGKVLHSTDEGD